MKAVLEGWLNERCHSRYRQSDGPERGENRAEMLQLGWPDSELCEDFTENKEEKTCVKEPEAMC